ncbi:MAG: SDR family NAD(P)-dependent oxidoreductase [Myxococcales bacterium]|nr:SDR family NAD(P)-dependent oxidoreductase [Myxococcales bacterium]
MAKKSYAEKYGPWALVIGGSTTIGEQFTRQLAARGMNVAVVARRASVLAELAAEVQAETGMTVRPVALDLAHEGAFEQLERAVADVEIGMLVVNANLHKVNLFDKMPPEQKRMMCRLNYEMPVMLTDIFGAKMVARGRGGIIYINALNSVTPIEIDAVFQGTKAGLRIFAESLWIEYRKHGVQVASAHVNGIEGSESYEAKLPESTRKALKVMGVSMHPEKIVARILTQFDKGKLILCPDVPVPINRSAMKALDLSRFFGGGAQLRAWSWLFKKLLSGDEVLEGMAGAGASAEAPRTEQAVSKPAS